MYEDWRAPVWRGGYLKKGWEDKKYKKIVIYFKEKLFLGLKYCKYWLSIEIIKIIKLLRLKGTLGDHLVKLFWSEKV